jgi:TolB protein
MKTMKNPWLLALVSIVITPFYCAGAEEKPNAPGIIETDTLPKDTKVAVVSETKEEVYIITMNPDGSNQLLLNGDKVTSGSPSWSPDGKRIAFMSREDGKPEIYVIKADGTDKVQITNSKPVDNFFGARYPNYPSWSPDGKKIVFVSRPQPGHKVPELYVMNADGTDPTRLTQTKVFPDSWIVVGLGPVSWSPDGKKIVYAATKDDRMGIHVINSDGTNPVSLAKANGSCASWSPDGKRIVFMAQNGDHPSEICIMDADGNNLIALPHTKPSYGFPSWLPDGKKIAFSGDGDDGPGLYIMNADGSHPAKMRYELMNADDKLAPSRKEGLDIAVWSPFLR